MVGGVSDWRGITRVLSALGRMAGATFLVMVPDLPPEAAVMSEYSLVIDPVGRRASGIGWSSGEGGASGRL